VGRPGHLFGQHGAPPGDPKARFHERFDVAYLSGRGIPTESFVVQLFYTPKLRTKGGSPTIVVFLARRVREEQVIAPEEARQAGCSERHVVPAILDLLDQAGEFEVESVVVAFAHFD